MSNSTSVSCRISTSVFSDATYLNLRRNQVQPEAVSIALGIKPDGHKEVLDYRIAPNESMTTWDELPRNLYDRAKAGAAFYCRWGNRFAPEVKRVYPMVSFQVASACHAQSEK
ncbi:transposase [Lactobacillus sp. R2/2]|nr:transposase [Lactobacillus sp. R2/2]